MIYGLCRVRNWLDTNVQITLLQIFFHDMFSFLLKMSPGKNEICRWSKTNTCISMENIHMQNSRAMKRIIDTSPMHKLQNLGVQKWGRYVKYFLNCHLSVCLYILFFECWWTNIGLYCIIYWWNILLYSTMDYIHIMS